MYVMVEVQLHSFLKSVSLRARLDPVHNRNVSSPCQELNTNSLVVQTVDSDNIDWATSTPHVHLPVYLHRVTYSPLKTLHLELQNGGVWRRVLG
jgi:hypothetical protein